MSTKPRKKTRFSASAASKRMYERLGYVVWRVERWIPQARRRIDLFGFGDLLAMKSGELIAIQTTTGSNMAKHVATVKANPHARTWLTIPGLVIDVNGWRILKHGLPRAKYMVRVERFACINDLEGEPIPLVVLP